MIPAIRQLIEKARADLQPLEPIPWSNITTWAAGVRAPIKAGASEHLSDFERVVQSPGGSFINPNIAASEWERPQQRQRRVASAISRNADNVRRAHAAKTAITAFLDSLLNLPPEVFAAARKATDDSRAPSTIYNMHVTNSSIGALASGPSATANGSITITQAEHRAKVAEAQRALVTDQDALDQLAPGIHDALYQFLRIAREIQVDQKNMAEIQTMMKDALDDVWARQLAEGLRSQALPKTLAVITALSKIPAMFEVVGKLTGVDLVLPSFIEDATELSKLVSFGHTTESLVLEFKEAFPSFPKGMPEDKRRDAQKELCRDIAQFANTNGGTLLIGVETGPGPSGMKVAKGVVPVENVEELRQRIEDAISAHLVPPTFTHPIVPVHLAGGTILAINVPAHRDLVVLWDKQAHTMQYVYRTSHGKEYLNPDEVERQRMNTSRAGRLAILQAKNDARSEQIEVVGGFRNRAGSPPDGRWQVASAVFGPIGEHTFELRLSSDGKIHTVALPFSFVENAWVGSDGR